MSRAQGIRGCSASQTCTPYIQIACDLNQRQLTGNLLPERGTYGLCREEVCRIDKPPRTALIASGHPP